MSSGSRKVKSVFVVDKRDEASPCLPQALMGIDLLAIDIASLIKEVCPELAPLHEALDPPLSIAQGLYAEQLLGKGVELLSCLQVRS